MYSLNNLSSKPSDLIISSEPIGQRNFARQDHPLIKEFNYSAAEAILNMRLKTKSLAGSPKWRTNLLEKGTATGHRALGLKAQSHAEPPGRPPLVHSPVGASQS